MQTYYHDNSINLNPKLKNVLNRMLIDEVLHESYKINRANFWLSKQKSRYLVTLTFNSWYKNHDVGRLGKREYERSLKLELYKKSM